MKRRSIYVFISATLAMIVPTPGRFVYALILILELNFLILSGTFANSIVKKFKLDELRSTVIFITVISATIFYKELITFLNPEVVLTLGFNMYLIPVSFFVIGYLFSNEDNSIGERYKFTYYQCFILSIYTLIISLIRDIFGYGTITYFGSGFNICEKVIFSPDSVSVLSILASIPGVLFLSSVLLFIYVIGRGKITIMKNIQSIDDEVNSQNKEVE